MKKLKFEPKSDLAMHPEAVGLVWPSYSYRDSCTDSGIFVLQICGPLEHKSGAWFENYESILGRFEGALCDDDVRAVILQIDSPGGEVSGLQETVRRMIECKERYGKPVVAYCDEEAYSAAYALATSADDIYLPESGGCGSVGVLATVCDRTQATKDAGLRIEVVRSGTRKAEGHPDIPLSDSVLSRVQKRVDELGKQFFRLVSQSRPISIKDLKDLQGATVFGQKAVDIGLATAVASFDEVVEILENQLDLTQVSNKIERIEGSEMDIAQLNKRVAAAIKAVENAKTPTDRKSAALALSRAQALLTEAKVKKTYQKKTIEEETEEDDGEADNAETEDEESAEEEEAPPSSKAPPSDDDDGDEDSKKMKKSKKASSLDGNSIESFVKSITGQSNASTARKVIEAMAETASRAEAAERKIAKLEADAESAKLEKVITEGVAAGQLKPAQLEWARTQSMASLKAYLKATPPMFAPREQPALQDIKAAATEEPGKDGLTDAERKICALTGTTAESYLKQKTLGLAKVGN